MFRRARLPVLLLMAVRCTPLEEGPHESPGPFDAGPSTSYTVTRVTSACDDLSTAEILGFGTFTHVTDYTELPFPFPLFGETATRFVVAEQGQIFLGDASLFVSTVGEPREPPDERIPNGWVAPFWEPLLSPLGNNRGDVRVLWTGTDTDERFVIGYNDFTLRFPSDKVPNPDVHLSFQVALLPRSQAIEFRYCELNPGASPSQELRDRVRGAAAEIGLESADGSHGVSYSFKTPLELEGSAIRFTPVP